MNTGGGPLADVKVLDFMWAVAGPAATRMLVDYGATVVRIESPQRVDAIRTVGPYLPDPAAGGENSAAFHNLNAGKLMLTLDLAKPEARAVALDLVRWADVVTESFTPKAMRNWGLDYGSLCAVKPDIVMLSTCLMGQTGPAAGFAGFGNLAAAMTGFFHLCGWADRPPAGPFGAYTDYIAPRFNAVAILAALDHRRRTGEGQHIDLSQAEAALHFLGPAILDRSVNGRVQTPDGNRDANHAPHGVYPASGDDRWVAIAVTDDAAFQALAAALGRADLATDPRLATAAGRLGHQDEIDNAIAAWTSEREADAVEAELQARGVAAHVVASSADLCADPQLTERGHFVRLPHPTAEATVVEHSRFKLGRTPAVVSGTAPTYGRDNQYVLESILGYDDSRITELVVAGALG